MIKINPKVLFFVSISLLLVGSIFIMKNEESFSKTTITKPLTQKEVSTRWYFWDSIMNDTQKNKTIYFENIFNVPDEHRAFPYVKIKQ